MCIRDRFWEVELRKPLSGDRLHPALASAEGSRDAWETRSFSLASRMRSKATGNSHVAYYEDSEATRRVVLDGIKMVKGNSSCTDHGSSQFPQETLGQKEKTPWKHRKTN